MSLQQVLAPQMQQSLQLLQAPTLELRQLIHQELQQNPTLEEITTDVVSIEAETESLNAKDERKEKDELDFKEEYEVLAKLDEEWREYFSRHNVHRQRSPEEEEARQFLFDSLVQPESLQEHLLNQLQLSGASDQERRVGELLIGSIDDNGYLSTSLEDISQNSGLPVEELQHVLDLIQTFSPVGVGARDLRECLLIQLERLGKSDSIEAAIVRDHLEDLGKKRYPEIAKALNLTIEDINRIASFISTLEPRPGRAFSHDANSYVTPDVLVKKMGDDFSVILNDDQIPHLRISNTYKELMARDNNAQDVKDYLKERIRAAKFIIKSIHQRQQTIYNIATEIVKRQRDFFEKGVAGLKPLTMNDVAQVVGVHETTVSRAVSNKYMQTPHGIFEMKYFFTSGYTTADGQVVSNTSVKEAVAELIAKEDPSKPLSDQEIVKMLTEKGIPIARRTVAKYRAELKILPSHLRKKF
jgi:RNA polymerase sigma-54 factor